MQTDIIESDVLVIGGGVAGCRAAIEASDLNARVVLTTKGLFGRDCAATWMAALAFQCWGIHPEDPLDRAVEDTVRCGWFLNNQENVYAFLAHVPDAVRDLLKWGVRFKSDKGELSTTRQLGQSIEKGRSLTAAQWPRGELGYNFVRAVPRVVKSKPIEVRSDVFIVDLLTSDGAVVGALGIDMKKGQFKVFKSKATILATGGYQGIYSFTTANPNLTGDGQAIALRAGADMMDFEFNQTLPCAVWPPNLSGDILPFDLILEAEGRMYNSDHERFMSKWDPNLEHSSRALLSRAIFHEITAGKTSPHGGIYVSITHQPASYIDAKVKEFRRTHTFLRFEKTGIDLHTDGIETGYAMHYCQGGCNVSPKCETDLPGLYAIGEVVAGGNGADRMTANALPYCTSMGIICGDEAGRKALNSPVPRIDDSQIQRLIRKALAPLERSEGVRVYQVKPPLQDLMAKETLYGRTEEGLSKALKEVQRLKNDVVTRLSVPNKAQKFNTEWINALEFSNMVLVSECIIRNAGLRTESRGLHDRTDYPKPDPDWFKNIHLRLVADGLKQWTEPVQFTYFRPEPGSLGEPWRKAVAVKKYEGWRAVPIYETEGVKKHA